MYSVDSENAKKEISFHVDKVKSLETQNRSLRKDNKQLLLQEELELQIKKVKSEHQSALTHKTVAHEELRTLTVLHDEAGRAG